MERVTAVMRLALLLVLVACEKAPPDPQHYEPEPPRLRYAAKTENSVTGTNQTFFHIVEDERLFAVADAGGRSLGDPSKLAAEATSPFPSPACRSGSNPRVQLACGVRIINERLAGAREGTVSLAVVVVVDRTAHVAVAGDAHVVWLHGRDVEVRAARVPEQRLGSSAAADFSIFSLELADGDSLAIVNKGLINTIGTRSIARVLGGGFATSEALERAVVALIAEAERIPDHPALTAIVVHVVPF